MSTGTRMFWRLAQVATWAAGIFIWSALIFKPSLGLHLFWNVLISVAPALFVLAPGVWRNICPLGSMSLAPHHFGLSRRKQLSFGCRGWLFLTGFGLLIVIVPLRKVLLNTNGPVLAAILGAMGLLAVVLGLVFNQKSGWCSSLCPIYPVEVLYGSRPVVTVANAHCPQCSHCVEPCSESTPHVTPTTAVHTRLGKFVGIVLPGFFPGFVWGWFNVPNYSLWEGLSRLHVAYGVPYTAGGLTLILYLALRMLLPKRDDLILLIFTAAAIVTYYWFRLPPMLGFGDSDDAVFDVAAWLPSWSAMGLRFFAFALFGWLMLGRTGVRRAWEFHPQIRT